MPSSPRPPGPPRQALRGTLDAMSSKFLNKCFVFIKDAIRHPGDVEGPSHSDPPRWVVTTRPWAHVESRQWCVVPPPRAPRRRRGPPRDAPLRDSRSEEAEP
jgi:hypothetical protein